MRFKKRSFRGRKSGRGRGKRGFRGRRRRSGKRLGRYTVSRGGIRL